MRLLNKILITGLLFSFALSLSAQEWTTPADQKDKTCPLPFDTKMQQSGKDIFNKNCKSCHGDIGKNNPVALTPDPGDPANEKFAVNTDGELFYKITMGKGSMPKFKDMLSENDRWAIVSYIRTFHPDYKPANVDVTAPVVDNTFKGENIKLFVDLDQVNLTATVNVQGDENGETKPANGVRVGFFIKRNFGLLSVCDPVTTNEKGIAIATFPGDLPGDSLGNYNMIIKLIDTDVFGDVEYTQNVNWGENFVFENPLDHREMWGNRGNAPLWLLITYFTLLFGGLAVIGWVVLQILKLKKS